MLKFRFINWEWWIIPKTFYHHIYWKYLIAWINTDWKQTRICDIIWINRHVVNRDEKYNRLPIWQRLSAQWWLAGMPIPAQSPLTIQCTAEVSLNLFRICACLRILQLMHLPQKMRQRRQKKFKKNITCDTSCTVSHVRVQLRIRACYVHHVISFIFFVALIFSVE